MLKTRKQRINRLAEKIAGWVQQTELAIANSYPSNANYLLHYHNLPESLMTLITVKHCKKRKRLQP